MSSDVYEHLTPKRAGRGNRLIALWSIPRQFISCSCSQRETVCMVRSVGVLNLFCKLNLFLNLFYFFVRLF